MIPTHPNLLKSDTSLLVIVDVQSKLTAAMPTADAQVMTENTVKLCSAANWLQIPVLLTEQYPKGLGATIPAILNNLPPDTHCFEKTYFSCCGADGFTKALNDYQRQQIILVGQETHVCILQSALDLIAHGFLVTVVDDAVCSRQASHKQSALHRLIQQGVTVSNHESVLFEWLRTAKHPEFKKISSLLR